MVNDEAAGQLLAAGSRQRQLFYWSVGGAVLVQLLLFACATAPGLAGTADSAFYVHAARSLRATGRLLHPDGTAYRFWPPLYPLLLAAGGSLGILRALHALALAGSLLSWSWGGRLLLPFRKAAVLPWLLALSTPWLLVGKFVWGEAVFLLLFSGYALALVRWVDSGRLAWLAGGTALGFMLPLQRTAGFFLLAGAGAGLLAWSLWPAPQRRRLGQVVVHLALSGLGGLAWHYYALLVAAPVVYRLNRGWTQFFSSAADYGFVLGRWLLPLPATWRTAGPVAAWALLLVALAVLLWPRRSADLREGRLVSARLLWGTVFGFVAFLVVSTTFTRSAAGLHDSERYASVLFAPVALLALSRLQVRGWVWAVLLGGWLGFAALRAGANAAAFRRQPVLAWPTSAQAGQGRTGSGSGH